MRFDSGPIGVLINAANKLSYGSFWGAKTCTGPEHDNTIETDGAAGQRLRSPRCSTRWACRPGRCPTYPPAPHCNTRGLTEARAPTRCGG